MDALTNAAPAARLLPEPALPPEAPLAMAAQDFRRRPERVRSGTRLGASLIARRAFVFGGAIALTGLAAYEMYKVLDVGGLTYLEYAVLVLFVVLFAWIGLAFTNALGGAISLLSGRKAHDIDPDAPLPSPTIRTALLMPCYNEEPHRVFAGLEATWRSLEATGRGDLFDVFILSDTTDPDVWVAEEAAFLALRRRTGGCFHYRRRAQNTDRKAGNIADWVTRFGAAYEAMLILDADSVMTGDCMVRLADGLERTPDAGLIQTLPVIVGGRTLFARLQQFAGRLYGPLIAQGLAWWHGPQSNYWGHNAIIRTRAFAEAAGLPHLKGRKPFGGHILSHDFVEAALLVRAGWGVYMVAGLPGSYEEGPPSLTDLAVRDRRWCQGNLQHAAVLPVRGLSAASRIHLLTGIGSYVSAPLWLLMLLAGLLTSLQARFVPPDYFPSGFALFPVWPAQDPVRAAWVFGGTMAVLLMPKFIAFALMLGDGTARRGFGGGGRTFLGMISEILLSGLMAPVTMVSQSFAVVSILMGRDGGWNPQRRDDGSLGWREAFRHFWPHTLLGLGFAAATAAIAWPLMAWMSPVILGLLTAMPLAVWTSRPRRPGGLLSTPEAQHPPPVLRAATDLRAALTGTDGPAEAVARLAGDADLLAFHRNELPAQGKRLPGDVRPDRLVARAKIEDARSRGEALALLSPKEKAAALADDQALARLLALT
ncbi:membrane glycosyltransferase [Xanthobacter flavus]|uniref:Glucans biosynthesis glucosyltransferase H n=1 Tax=Xanthobacter flavus TaxID=281 RepID=A0A9W6FK40_XANFL|nr:glucans biosynthesis glucosyltransferase MdoH [Xanthobacter flavus]MDR6334201.1 membrane glycosyltransferase [Xanthobacter flavus]GLI22921.1 glucans biosynthesis glucosyltransferase H [Xanthobacter flavus]